MQRFELPSLSKELSTRLSEWGSVVLEVQAGSRATGMKRRGMNGGTRLVMELPGPSWVGKVDRHTEESIRGEYASEMHT